MGIVLDESSVDFCMLEITLACFRGKLKAAAKSKLDIGPKGANGGLAFGPTALLVPRD